MFIYEWTIQQFIICKKNITCNNNTLTLKKIKIKKHTQMYSRFKENV